MSALRRLRQENGRLRGQHEIGSIKLASHTEGLSQETARSRVKPGRDGAALGRQMLVDLRVPCQPGLQSEFLDSQGYTEKPCFEKQILKNEASKPGTVSCVCLQYPGGDAC